MLGPLAADAGRFPDFRFVLFLMFSDFADFPVGFEVWEGSQSMGNDYGLQMNEFSAHSESYGLSL